MTLHTTSDRGNVWKVVFFLLAMGIATAGAGGMLKVLADATAASAGSTPVVPVAEKAQSAFAFINSIGVNTHLNYFDRTYGNFPLVEKELRSIGIRHLRDGAHLQDPAYNSMLYGRWMDLGRMGIRFDVVLDPRSKLGPLTPALLQHVEQLAGNTIESF
jgi:hypothetical protein